MIAANDEPHPLYGALSAMAAVQLRQLIALASGHLADRTSIPDAELALSNVSAALALCGGGDPRPEGGMKGLLKAVATDHGLSPDDIVGGGQRRLYAHARQDFMWRCRQVRWPDGRHRYSLPQIAQFLGGLDHTTVLHGVRAHARRLAGEQA